VDRRRYSLGKEFTKSRFRRDEGAGQGVSGERSKGGASAEVDEHLMEKYVHGEPITPAELKAAVQRARSA